ncbi:hypothetical protein B0H19DRAFT_1264938 [Mycena capillaripes]|nr:hypothetical protein B0H19DRAFT_1264938 [Mycena capillaripes]
MRVVSFFSLAAAVVVSLAWAFTIVVPTNPTSGQVTEIDWTFIAKDPATFDLESIQTSLGTLQYQLPALPAIGYALRICDMNNVGIVLA